MIPDCFVGIANLLSSPGPTSALCELLTLHLRPKATQLTTPCGLRRARVCLLAPVPESHNGEVTLQKN